MKIAIMTQPLGKNYGGIMQAWALQQVLKRIGHEVVTIDRQPDRPSLAYKAARLAYRTGMKAIGRRKAPINFEKHLPSILQHTQGFIAEHIRMSEPLYSTRELRAHFDRENYDAVIVGSDQTWRPQYSPNIYNFFLDFLEDRNDILRIAYAASFGVDQWEYSEEQTRRCAELAKKFDAISVREDSGVELCRKYLGVEATHVLDPTLLLERQDYIELIGPERIRAEAAGVYTYFLDKTPEKQALAKQASEQLAESVFACQAASSIGTDHRETASYVMPDPRDWLAGFFNARCVLTDSFHGMVFSILFNKELGLIKNPERGLARFSSLIKNLENEKELNLNSESKIVIINSSNKNKTKLIVNIKKSNKMLLKSMENSHSQNENELK